jgi:hypothetical protein
VPASLAPEELVDPLEHLVGAHLEGVDLVRDTAELVCLVRDGMGEGRIIGRPAQQQVVVGHDQVRSGEGGAATPERAGRLRPTLLACALLRARRDGAFSQISQSRVAHEERTGQRTDLAVGPELRARAQHRVRDAVFREQSSVAAFREHLLTATGAHVVRAPLDRHRAQTGISEHRGRRRDVLREQLVLEELRSRGHHDGLADPSRGALHRKRDHRGQIGEGLADSGPTLEEQPPALVEHAHELASHADLLLAHAIAREVASPPRLVGERRRDGVGIEGHG